MIFVEHVYKLNTIRSTSTIDFRRILAYAIFLNDRSPINKFVSHNLVLTPVRTTFGVKDFSGRERHLFSFRSLIGETSIIEFSRGANGNNQEEVLRALLEEKYKVFTTFAGVAVSFRFWDRHIPTARKIVPSTIDIYCLGNKAFDAF